MAGDANGTKEKMIGSGTLTLAARLSSLAGAGAFAAVIGGGTWIGPKAWNLLTDTFASISRIELYIAGATAHDAAQDLRLSGLELRVNRLEDRAMK